jgi:uncharacterized protein
MNCRCITNAAKVRCPHYYYDDNGQQCELLPHYKKNQMAPTKNLIPVTDSHLGTINTRSGLTFDYKNPTAAMIDIKDIAIGLSHECRFAGQIGPFYSVAQHSVIVSFMVPNHLAKEALLHDAHEAWYKDIPKPLKNLIGQEYPALTELCDKAIWQKFNLKNRLDHADIKKADRDILVMEHAALFKEKPAALFSLLQAYELYNETWWAWPPTTAYQYFLLRYKQLFN